MTEKKTAAVIMAGGRGERLRPITDTMPKPAVEVGGKPALGYALSMIKEAGLRSAIVTVQYRYEDIRDRFGDTYDGVTIDYYIEDEPLGTAGSVRAAVHERFYDDSFEELIVLSGDAVCDFDLRPALSAHRNSGADATLLLAESSEPWKYGCVTLDSTKQHGRIVDFIEKPRDMRGTALVNTGIYILSRETVDRIPKREYDFGRDLFPLMIKEGARLNGFVADGYWCDIGSPESYRRASFDAAKNKIRGVSASVSPTGAVVSADCRAGMGSTLSGCVLGHGVTVGVDVHATDSVLCRDVTVGDGVVIGSGSVIGEGAFISTGTVIDAGSMIGAGEEVFTKAPASRPSQRELPLRQ